MVSSGLCWFPLYQPAPEGAHAAPAPWKKPLLSGLSESSFAGPQKERGQWQELPAKGNTLPEHPSVVLPLWGPHSMSPMRLQAVWPLSPSGTGLPGCGVVAGTPPCCSADPAQLLALALGLAPVFAERQNLRRSNCLFAPCN